MALEIERKFLVKGEYKSLSHTRYAIKQGYLSQTTKNSVRVRVRGEEGFITVKSRMRAGSFSRGEWEYAIPVQEAEDMLKLAIGGIINKTRYLVKSGKHTIEIDEFHDKNQGLIMAEIELSDENESFDKPDWLGEEVTHDMRYYNSYLSNHPYTTWKMEEK